MVDAPPPQSLSGTVCMGSVWNRGFVHPTGLPQTLCPCNPLGWPTVQVSFSLKSSPLKSRVPGSTGHPDKRALWGALGRAGRCHPGCWLRQVVHLPDVPRLFYTWEFPCSVGNKDQSGNAALTHLSADSMRASILGCSYSTILSPPILIFLIFFLLCLGLFFSCFSSSLRCDLRLFMRQF